MKEEMFNKLIKFFEQENIKLVYTEGCHKCMKEHTEDLDLAWLYDKLVLEDVLGDEQ